MKIKQNTYTISNDFSDFINLPKRLYRGDPFYMGREEKYTGETKFFTVLKDNNAVSRCAAIINPEISHNGLKTGIIGFFESFDDVEAVNLMFENVFEYFKSLGIEFVAGPINGSIWNNFRITIPNEGYPEFFLENYHKNYYNTLFEQKGFKPIKQYISTLYTDIKKPYQRCEKFEEYFKNKGITIRNFNTNAFEEDLKNIYDICLKGFKGFEMFAPITFEEFAPRYISVKPLINPKYFLIAEIEGKPCGFIFAINNLFESIHFTFKRTLIIRHLACCPDIAPMGLGTFLVEKMHKIASEEGFDEIIHSMTENVLVPKITHLKENGIIRKYNLYGLNLK